MLKQNQNNIWFFEFDDFKQSVLRVLGHDFEWPSNNHFSNSFTYLYEQYTDNVKTNLRTHCEARLKFFFKMRCYELNDIILRRNEADPVLFDNNDVNNAIKYTYKWLDRTGGDAEAQTKLQMLLDELRAVGAPNDCNIKEFIDDNWFQSLKMWINIQRDIQQFHLAYANVRRSWYFFKSAPHNVTRPFLPEPPEVTNFVIVPICSFQRRHIKIDTTALYNILCGIKAVPRKIGARMSVKGEMTWINTKQNEFLANMPGSWRLFFDMDKIKELGLNKKTFGNSIVTDGVSCSVMFEKPPKPDIELNKAELIQKIEAGGIRNQIGLDPGMKTFIAAVRKNLVTGEEVTTFFYCILRL